MRLLLLTTVLVSTLVTSLYPSTIKSPSDLGKWLSESFTYQAEKEDYWKTPEETVKDKGGDCEDFAILAQKVLEDLGYKAYLIILANKETNKGHAVCLFKEKDGTFSVFDNYTYTKYGYKSWKLIFYLGYIEYKDVYVSSGKGFYKKILTIK
jgi:plasmid rolling circle replication initiator protein Rep